MTFCQIVAHRVAHFLKSDFRQIPQLMWSKVRRSSVAIFGSRSSADGGVYPFCLRNAKGFWSRSWLLGWEQRGRRRKTPSLDWPSDLALTSWPPTNLVRAEDLRCRGKGQALCFDAQIVITKTWRKRSGLRPAPQRSNTSASHTDFSNQLRFRGTDGPRLHRARYEINGATGVCSLGGNDS